VVIYQFNKKEMYIMKKTLIIFVILLSMVWTVGAWAELKEGLWEITTQVEMKGIPGMPSMQPTTVRQCITKSNPVPQNKDKDVDCKPVNVKTSGDTVTYNMECKGKDGGVIQTSGTSTYTGNSLSGSSTTNIIKKGQPKMQMSVKTRGKYIGICTK
jgi:hypothetical protein